MSRIIFVIKPAPILQVGNPVLRQVASPLPPEAIRMPEIQELIDLMIVTMRQAPGVGLAAPQIGVPMRIVVLEDSAEMMGRLTEEQRAARGRTPFDLTVLVNPELTNLSAETAKFAEGCLSIERYTAEVERSVTVDVAGYDREGRPVAWRAAGWQARILQHEVDHLNGVLFTDRMDPLTLASTKAPPPKPVGGVVRAALYRGED